MAHGDLLKGAGKLAPRFAAGPLKATCEGTEGVTTASNQPMYYGTEKLRASMLDPGRPPSGRYRSRLGACNHWSTSRRPSRASTSRCGRSPRSLRGGTGPAPHRQRQQVRAYTRPERPPGAVRAGTGNPDGVMRGGNPMKDEALERVWASREAISRRCGYDSRRLVRYLQQRKERREAGQPLAPDRGATATPLG